MDQNRTPEVTVRPRRILLVEPEYRSSYPPLGLMKLATYHRLLGDEIVFVRGLSLEHATSFWDRIYITSLFTYDWTRVLDAIHFYRDNLFGVSAGRVVVGGIAATLLSGRMYNETGVMPVHGPLLSARQVGDESDTCIDQLVPDYSILAQTTHRYRYGTSFLGRTTRGCIRACRFCAVRELEPEACDYLDIRPIVEGIRKQIGDQPELVLLDNNVLASTKLKRIVDDIVSLGFERDAKLGKRAREVDFNQGLDARLMMPRQMAELARLPLKPVRIAYDRAQDSQVFERAVRLAAAAGFRDISNYLLYNFDDHPEDLWRRMHHCVELGDELDVRIWSFPMRYVPIADTVRSYVGVHWNRRLLRGVQCISLVTKGTISARHDFFHRAFGYSEEDFLEILSMPDRYIIQRAQHETNGAQEWRSLYRSLSRRERRTLWQVTSARGRRELAEAHGALPPGKVKTIVSHYLEP